MAGASTCFQDNVITEPQQRVGLQCYRSATEGHQTRQEESCFGIGVRLALL